MKKKITKGITAWIRANQPRKRKVTVIDPDLNKLMESIFRNEKKSPENLTTPQP